MAHGHGKNMSKSQILHGMFMIKSSDPLLPAGTLAEPPSCGATAETVEWISPPHSGLRGFGSKKWMYGLHGLQYYMDDIRMIFTDYLERVWLC